MFDGGGDLSTVDEDELSRLLREASDEVNRAEVRRLEVAAEWDRRQAWARDGSYNGRCWLAHECTLSRTESARILKTAKVVASAPLVAAAVADGTLPVSKAEVLASVVNSRVEDAFVHDQQVLLDAVAPLSVDHTRRVARYWQLRADEDGAEPVVKEAQLRCTVDDDGNTHLSGVLDVEGGAQFRAVLDSIADRMWRAQRTENQQEERPQYMRETHRAAALVEMARLAASADPARTGSRPLLSVIIDLATLENRADHPAVVERAGLISAEDARRLACDAYISRVLTGADGVILEMGRSVRTVTPGQLRFITLRDGGCTWPGCDRPPGWCQAHHIIWWENGGLTDVSGMTLLCNHHHHKIHDGGWHLERLDDGGLRFTGPYGQTLIRPPPSMWIPMTPPASSRAKISYIEDAAIRARVRALTA